MITPSELNDIIREVSTEREKNAKAEAITWCESFDVKRRLIEAAKAERRSVHFTRMPSVEQANLRVSYFRENGFRAYRISSTIIEVSWTP